MTLDTAKRQRILDRAAAIPLLSTLGFHLSRLDSGECDIELDNRRDLDGIFDSLHGGILATLADSAVAFAALTLIEPDETITTIEFNIRFFAPCREAVIARARLLKSGRTLISGEVRLEGKATGTLFAVSGVTYIRLASKRSQASSS